MLFIHASTFVFCKNRRWACFFVCFIAGFVLFLRQDPWFLPGMTALLALVVFCGCLLFFWQKNIRTKVCIEEFNIHSNGFDVYSNSSMLAPAVLSFKLSFCRYEHKSFVSFKYAVLCTYKFVCMMNIWQKWHELVHVRAVGYSSLCILMFFCLIYCCFQLGVCFDPWSLPGMTA